MPVLSIRRLPRERAADMFLAMAPGTVKPIVNISSTQRAMRVPRKKLTELVAFVAVSEGTAVCEGDIAVVASAEIAAMNRRYLGHAGPTDVLSFDMSDSGSRGISAQIVVCGDVAVKQARARGLGQQRELMLYVVHGLLHLMGYDDQSPRGAAKMHAREDEILEAFARTR